MGDGQIFPIETRRLVLRPFAETDLDAIHLYHRREDVARYQFWEPRSREELAAKLSDWSRRTGLDGHGEAVALVVQRKEGMEIIGDIFLALRDRAARQGEIGYSFHPDHHGRGYASEAVGALLALGFATYGLHRIYGRCDARNRGSFRLMERLGMRREAHFREHALFKGGWDEEFVYAILEDEWRSAAT